MKRILSLLSVAAMFFTFFACTYNPADSAKSANKNVETTRTIALPYFNKIVVDGVVDVKFNQSDRSSADIKGRSKAVEKVEAKVDGQTLYLSLADDGIVRLASSDKPDVYVSSPHLVSVVLRGAGEFEAYGAIRTDTLGILLQGAGEIDFDKVVCDRADISLHGAGNIDVEGLKANVTKIDLNGAGTVDVDFDNSGSVDCLLRGVGNVELEGVVSSLTQHSDGVGSIDTRKLRIAGKKH